MRLIIIGSMASGKSTVGRKLSKRLGLDFFDIDNEIEKKAGAKISWIFDVEGEEKFRDREYEAFSNLTTNERKWLQEAVNLSVPFQRELWIKSEEESMRAIINSGVEIIYPDKDLFKKASLPMYDKLKKDKEINYLITRIKDEKIKN